MKLPRITHFLTKLITVSLCGILFTGSTLAGTCCVMAASGPAHTADPEAAESEQRYVFRMDTIITLTAYGSKRTHALDLAEAEILRLDNLLSTGIQDSEISQLNRTGSAVLSPDTAAIVGKALELYRLTDGLFDITIYPLMQLWGFATNDLTASIADSPQTGSTQALASALEESEHHYHVPTQEELDEALSKIGSDRLSFDADTSTLTLGKDQSIDLGGIAKGYISQRLMEIYRAVGLTSGMVSLGGNVQCLGTKPDGSSYKIAIRNPLGNESDFAAILQIQDQAVITSGGYERYFTDEATGITYQHIMNPETGIPVEGDLASVTIVTKDGMLGDGLSTSLYIMGKEKAIAYWRSHSKEFDMLLIDKEGSILISEGLSGQLLSPDHVEIVSLDPE